MSRPKQEPARHHGAMEFTGSPTDLDAVRRYRLGRVRVIKSAGEIALMRCAIDVCQPGMDAMYRALEPGVTENALWARLHETNIRLGGEWIETRPLTSGPRTKPWYREVSIRPIGADDLGTG